MQNVPGQLVSTWSYNIESLILSTNNYILRGEIYDLLINILS